LRLYDSFGRSSDQCERVHPKKQVAIRMQVRRIFSEHDHTDCLGSVLFANSFLLIDQANFICTTKQVPNFMSWHTTHRHFMNMPLPILTEKALECEQLGDKILKDHHPLVLGLQPVSDDFQHLCRDSLILIGKLQFYQKGFIFVDIRQGPYVVPYSDCVQIKFHMYGED
jgi:hypothetical protein